MDSSNTDQSADTEAEAALIAISQPLVWEEAEPYDFKDWGYRCFATTGNKEYSVRFRAGTDALVATLFIEEQEQQPCPFNGTLEKMKAACERHHATGKWE